MTKTNALLLVGSPKANKSTSHSLGNYLMNRLKEQDISINYANIYTKLKSENDLLMLMSSITDADFLILAFPLYVDCLPAPVIKLMEFISREYTKKKSKRRQTLTAIVNCGFPEASQANIAIEICHVFAQKMGIEFAGGLALGCGGAIAGRPLGTLGGMARNIRKSLDIAATTIATRKSIPEEAKRLMRKNIMPKWVYIFIATLRWKRIAKKYGSKNRLYDKPYE